MTEHGVYRTYTKGGCRCDQCTDAHRRYEKRRKYDIDHGRPRRVQVTGTIRRIEALAALGYSARELSRRLGWTECVLPGLTRRAVCTDGWICTTTAEKVAAIYDELCMIPRVASTSGELSSIVRTLHNARKNGFAPPLAWDNIDDPDEKPSRGRREPFHSSVDEVVVQRILDGDWNLCREATKAERIEVTRLWMARGGSQSELERRSKWRPDRYVERKVETPAGRWVQDGNRRRWVGE